MPRILRRDHGVSRILVSRGGEERERTGRPPNPPAREVEAPLESLVT
jgi:hypothetical protein